MMNQISGLQARAWWCMLTLSMCFFQVAMTQWGFLCDVETHVLGSDIKIVLGVFVSVPMWSCVSIIWE